MELRRRLARQSHLYIDKKQRNLLLESEISKEFPFLAALLGQHESIPRELVDNLPREQQVFFNHTLPKVLQQAQAEWYAEDTCRDLGEISVHCTICNTPNRYIYYITNHHSGKTINVGSECIQKFFDNITERKGKKGFKLDREQARKIRRLDVFYKQFPGADTMLESWLQELDNLPILVPYEAKYRECCLRGRQLIKEFQECTRDDHTIFRDFRQVIKDRDALWRYITSYVERNLNDPWAATREIKEWLQRNHKIQVLRRLKEDCRITTATFPDIWEPAYLKRILPILNEVIAPISITITAADHSTGSFILQPTGEGNLTLNCGFQSMLLALRPGVQRSNCSKPEHRKV